MSVSAARLTRTLLAGLIAAAFAPSAIAGTPNLLTVNSTLDVMNALDGTCTLREALHNANTNSAFGSVAGECATGVGNNTTDVIVLQDGATYPLTIDANGDDAGDLDVLDNADVDESALDLRIEVANGGNATVRQDASGERVLDAHGGLVEIAGVVFAGGNIDGGGGGIYNTGYLQLDRVTVRNNTANTGGGIYNGGDLVLLDSQVILNNGDLLGGGLMQEGGLMLLQGSTVRANTGGVGAGIYSVARDVVIEAGSAVNLNTATGNGGGLALVGNATLRVSDSEFSGNSSPIFGGAIYSDASSTMYLDRSQFTNNRASSGGAVYLLGPGTVQMEGGQFVDNEAMGGDGGAIQSSQLKATGTRFENNTATQTGGALRVSVGCTLTNAAVIGNSAADGAGVRAQFVTAQGTEFRANTASAKGGALNVLGGVTIDTSQFMGNSAVAEGGAIYLNAAEDSIITRSLFNLNAAGGTGGAIWTTGESLLIGNSTFSTNGAGDAGSALYVDEDGAAASVNNTFAINFPGTTLVKYGDMTIANTIMASMGEDNCVSSLDNISFLSLGGNLIDDTTCEGIDGPTDQVDVDAMLSALGNFGGGTRTHKPLEGSLAIGNAIPQFCAGLGVDGVDQRGATRPVLACDVGAHDTAGVLPPAIFKDGFEEI